LKLHSQHNRCSTIVHSHLLFVGLVHQHHLVPVLLINPLDVLDPIHLVTNLAHGQARHFSPRCEGTKSEGRHHGVDPELGLFADRLVRGRNVFWERVEKLLLHQLREGMGGEGMRFEREWGVS
jgi:hypothetical protein